MEYSRKKGTTFLATPYDKAAVDLLDKIGVTAFKIGSGDITWLEFLEYVASKRKPILFNRFYFKEIKFLIKI